MLKDKTITMDTDVVKRQIRIFKSELEDLVKQHNMDVVILEYSKQNPEHFAEEVKRTMTTVSERREPLVGIYVSVCIYQHIKIIYVFNMLAECPS